MSTEAIHAETLAAPAVAEDTPRADGLSALRERVERLEQQNRQLRRESLLLAGIVTIAAGILASILVQRNLDPQRSARMLASPRRIAAEAFVLTDAHGQPRAELKFIPIPEHAPGKADAPRH